jgi:hypothetical protein
MVDRMEIRIANVALSVVCEGAVILEEDPVYRPFIRKGVGSAGSSDLEIRLVLGEPETPLDRMRVFDSGQAWSLFRDGSEYVVELKPASIFGPAACQLRMDGGMRKATLLCSDPVVARQNGVPGLSNPVRYPLDQILMMFLLSRLGGVLVHAAGVDAHGSGFIFPGRSGAGKSTLSRLFSGREGIDVLSDDRMAVRSCRHEFKAHGTPWPGNEGSALNRGAPLGGILFLRHAERNEARRIGPREALEALLPVASIPWFDKDLVPAALAFCEGLVSAVPSYVMDFRPDAGAVRMLEETVFQGNHGNRS